MSHFITMIEVSVSHVLVVLMIVSGIEQVFQKTWVLSIEGWPQPST